MVRSKTYSNRIHRILKDVLQDDVFGHVGFHTRRNIVEYGSAIIHFMIRGSQYSKYRNEFTIRSRAKSGEALLEEIMDGFGEYLFVGFEDPEIEGELAYWILIDLEVVRDTVRLRPDIGVEKQNRDRKTAFKAFRISDFPLK